MAAGPLGIAAEAQEPGRGAVQLPANFGRLNQPNWRPSLPARSGTVTGDFRMVDLLTYAKVDPTSRGQ